MKAIYIYRIGHFFYKHRIPILPRLFDMLNFFIFNTSVPSSVEIGKGTQLAYQGLGTVIHYQVKIGENCVIGHGVTIGGRSNHKRVARLGNNVYVGVGARILGDLDVGDNVVVGANAVVTKSVPPNCVVAGIPARIISENIDIDEHCNIKAHQHKAQSGRS